MNTLDELVSDLNKKYGMGTVVNGSKIPKDPPRLPSGIFPLDFIIGGGIAFHQISVLVGPEHGGKTSSAMSFMQMASKICWRCGNMKEFCRCSQSALSMRSVWADSEGTFNSSWAESIGVAHDDYVLIQADDGNQYGDIICDALKADDCGLIVLDSVAALMPTGEVDASLEDQFIATQARLVSKLLTKVINRLIKENKRGHPCAALFTNQIRSNIGVMYGKTEIMPGGHFMRHAPSLIVRIAKRSMKDNANYLDKERKVLLAQKHAFRVDKFKNFILGDEGDFVRAVEDINTDKVKAKRGEVLDQKSFLVQIERNGLMVDGKKGFNFNGRSGTKSSFMEDWTSNKSLYYQDQRDVINQLKSRVIDHAE